MRFLNLRELAALVCSSNQFAAAASRLSLPHLPGLTSHPCKASSGGHAPSLLPHPRSVLRHLITNLDLHVVTDRLFSSCAPYSLRERCPELAQIRLQFFTIKAIAFHKQLIALPEAELNRFWPARLQTLLLGWSDVYSQGDVYDVPSMVVQLRLVIQVASTIRTLTSLSLNTCSNIPISEGAVYLDQEQLPPIFQPLLSLTQLTSLSLEFNDYSYGNTHTRWVSDEDCFDVIFQLPALTSLSVNDGRWSQEGLLSHLLHSDAAVGLRARLTDFPVFDWAVDEATLRMCEELQWACPLIAATLQAERD